MNTPTLRRAAILGGVRIPFARQNTNYVKTSNIEMLTTSLRGLVQRFGLDGARLGTVAAGAVVKHSRDANIAREAAIDSGLSPETSAFDVQIACATSMQTASIVANKIATGQIEVGIAAGVDSASDAPITVGENLRQVILDLNRARSLRQRLETLGRIRPSMFTPSIPNVNERRTGMSMGEHCELMVKEWDISREAQDELALASHRNGVRAWNEGFYDDLVVPLNGLTRDNNLRSDTSLAVMAKLKPAFDRTSGRGTLTAANSTPLTDGAASLLLSSEDWARANGHEVQAFLVDAEEAAVDFFSDQAEGLLMAPVHAAARLLARNSLTLQDFDYYEIHEAFAGQVLCTLAAWESEAYCRDKLELAHSLGAIDRTKLNVNGGSVGLGHPFAATGARVLAGAAKQLSLHRKKTGKSARTLVSFCAAGGLGMVGILES